MKRRMISILCLFSLLVGLCGCQWSLHSEQTPTTQQTQPATVSATKPTRPEIEFQGDQNTPPYFEQLANLSHLYWEDILKEMGLTHDQVSYRVEGELETGEKIITYLHLPQVEYLGYTVDPTVVVHAWGYPLRIEYRITYEDIQDFATVAGETLDMYEDIRDQLITAFGPVCDYSARGCGYTPQTPLGNTPDEIREVFCKGGRSIGEHWDMTGEEDLGNCYAVSINATQNKHLIIRISFLLPANLEDELELYRKNTGTS